MRWSALFAMVTFAAPGWSQDNGSGPHQVALGGPRFLRSAASDAETVDPTSVRALQRRVTLTARDATLGSALQTITRQTGVRFLLSRDVVPVTTPVRVEATGLSLAAALTELLLNARVDVAVVSPTELALVRRYVRPVPVQQGSIVGRVTDEVSGSPLGGAAVTVEGSDLDAATDPDGRYRIAGVKPGTHEVRARYIGYAPLTRSVTVAEGDETTADFVLERSAQKLDEVVTTGTVIPTEVKALPTPITIIGADDIAQRHPQGLQDVIRQAIPTAVAFDDPIFSSALSVFSVRGANSLNATGTMKIFVDGVEATSYATSPVDLNSVERVEVVRGPQAATLHGAGAAGGVVQIFTKRGDARQTRPQVDAQAELGLVQTPYADFGGVLRENYTGSLRGGGPDVSYNFGGSYTMLADYVPDGELSRQSSPSVYGGIHASRGVITADLSARYYRNELPTVNNPLLLTAGYSPFSRPNYTINDLTNETYGARIIVSPTGWWRNHITLGVDRQKNQSTQQRPRLTTPDDTLLSVFDGDTRKVSLGYNASVNGQLSTGVAGSLILGVDHYDQNASQFFTAQALSTEGGIPTAPPGAFTVNRSTVTNTGYFAQAQVGVHDLLFVTAGLRVEENSTFGEELGTPVSPRVGLSFVREIGQTTVKVRGSYGRAIRAPEAGFAAGSVSPTDITLANPLLGPEQQRGWDAGVDLVFGSRGSLSVTGYDQTATDLIAFVQVGDTPVPTSQFQNIGRVSNRGVEVEGALIVNPLQLKAQYGYVRSRIEDLGSAGPVIGLEVGRQPLGLPAHTAGASLTLAPRPGTTLTAGFTYVGSYRQTDLLALFRCLGETGPCPPDFDFVTAFPAFTKVNAAMTQRIIRELEGFVSADNLTNNEAYEGSNQSPVIGRTTMVGLHVSF